MASMARAQRRLNPHLLAASIAVALLLIWLAAMAIAIHHAALPPEASGRMIAVYPPGLTSEAMVERIASAGGNPVRQTWASSVWVVASDEPGFAGKLQQSGAMATYAELPIGMQMAGCFAWADVRVGQIFPIN